MCDLVLHGHRVPGHVNAFDWSKGGEGLPDGVLSEFVVNGSNVHATHDGERSLPLSRHLNRHTESREEESASSSPLSKEALHAVTHRLQRRQSVAQTHRQRRHLRHT